MRPPKRALLNVVRRCKTEGFNPKPSWEQLSSTARLTSAGYPQTRNNTAFLPGCRHLMARAASNTAFADGAKGLWAYAHIEDQKRIERISKSVGACVAAWQESAKGRLAHISTRLESGSW